MIDFDFAELDALNREQNFSGAYMVFDQQHILHSGAAGVADYATGTPFTLDTVSALGSTSKQYTATLALRLVASGELELDAPLAKYLPEYSHATEVTIRQLLNMDSGVPDYTDILAERVQKQWADAMNEENLGIVMNQVASDDYNLPELLVLINARPLDFAPGSKFAYSNTNYMLLSYVIARIVGRPFAQVLSETLLQPLGLTSARVGTQYSEANGYVLASGQPHALGRGRHLTGDGELVMNVRDLARWGQAVLNGQTLAPEQLQLSFELVHGAYGMGWMHRGHIYQHGGHILGYWAGIYMDIEHKWGSVWLFNTAHQSLIPDATWHKQVFKWHERETDKRK